MHRVLPVSKQPRLHDRKQPHAFESHGCKILMYAEQNQNINEILFHSVNAEFNKPNKNQGKICKVEADIMHYPFFSRFSFEILLEQISFQTAEAPKWSRSNLSAPFFPFKAPSQQKAACLLGIFHIPCNDTHFSPLQRALRQIPPNRRI